MNENGICICDDYKLIVTIVKKGMASKVVEFTKKHGAKGGTILLGRGTQEKKGFLKMFCLDYEPDKEIILTLVKKEESDFMLDLIIEKAQLNQPGKGVSFVLSVKGISGIFHLLKMNDLLN
ncbi:UNVERIFIED_CONTAM: nitrogen regulatory protein P-II family [Acetivibrio alkalicellulosi]